MRSALFAAGLITTASAAKVQQDKRQFSLPVEPSLTTLPDGEVISSELLGTFTSTATEVVPTGDTSETESVSVSVSVTTSVSVSTPINTTPTSGSASTTVTTTESTVTETETSGETGTETETSGETGTETGDSGEATNTGDGEDAAPMATPFAGAMGAMAAVGIAMAL